MLKLLYICSNSCYNYIKAEELGDFSVKFERMMTMFKTNEVAVRGGSETIRMTEVASMIALNVLQRVKAKEWTEEEVVAIAKDHDKMDNFLKVNNIVELEKFDCIKGLDEELVERMLKSQQSKRSRAKSKELTESVFVAMLVGAICENALRDTYNKEKGHFGAAKGGELTEEDFQRLADNQGDLAKAIRNVQSKRSIAKSKIGFDENSESYQQLIVTEERLKSLRTGTQGSALLPIRALLVDIDFDNMKAADAKALLAKINQLVNV